MKSRTFFGRELMLNHGTGAAGSLRVEIQSTAGQPQPSFALADYRSGYGDKLEGPLQRKGDDLASLPGRPVRMRFQLKECDLYSLRFR
ncbi:MAG: hypothetical protein HUU20_18670 [Pirellulales bacterium]|nr:hypothetical protein [Pirellulales bacterium]